MQVVIDKRYPIPANIKTCWQLLSNIQDLATCMPGASITEQVDATNYKGNVKVKVGPASASFGGDIEVLEVSPNEFKMRLMGKGADRAGSSASMELTASLEAQSDTETVLIGKADVIVNGKFAQYGGRMMTSVSDMIIQQFADNFAVKAKAIVPVSDSPNSGNETIANTGVTSQFSLGTPENQMKTELNIFSILWMLIKQFFNGVFGNKSS